MLVVVQVVLVMLVVVSVVLVVVVVVVVVMLVVVMLVVVTLTVVIVVVVLVSIDAVQHMHAMSASAGRTQSSQYLWHTFHPSPVEQESIMAETAVFLHQRELVRLGTISAQ